MADTRTMALDSKTRIRLALTPTDPFTYVWDLNTCDETILENGRHTRITTTKHGKKLFSNEQKILNMSISTILLAKHYQEHNQKFSFTCSDKEYELACLYNPAIEYYKQYRLHNAR